MLPAPPDPPDPLDRIREAYSARAAEYADVLGHMRAVAEPDRALVGRWADGLTGPILDVGCGPGHWTAMLRARGCAVAGVDPVPAFVAHARRAHPAVPFAVGTATALEARDGSLGGVLAWYSLIHADPDTVDAALVEFARCVRPGGGVLVGFFEGPVLEAFAHAIVTAHRWPIDAFAARMEAAGFTVGETHARTDPDARPHGAIVATRR